MLFLSKGLKGYSALKICSALQVREKAQNNAVNYTILYIFLGAGCVCWHISPGMTEDSGYFFLSTEQGFNSIKLDSFCSTGQYVDIFGSLSRRGVGENSPLLVYCFSFRQNTFEQG
jgi:hypothetical protein